MNKYEKRRTELRIYKAGSGLLSGDRNIKLDFRSKVLFWNLFELFYGLDKVISFVVHVSTSMTVYFRQMHLFIKNAVEKRAKCRTGSSQVRKPQWR